MKRLYLCRHAKSSWKDTLSADMDRRLNKRGKRDAPMMGKRFVNLGIPLDQIVSSPAYRALKTARIYADALSIPKERIRVVEELYAADVREMLDVIHHLDEEHDRVAIVGHNPEMTMTSNCLGDLDLENVPTCGVVALDFPVNRWEEVGDVKGHLVFFWFPKDAKGEAVPIV